MRRIKKKKLRKAVRYGVIFCLLAAILWNIYEYLKLKKRAEYYLKRELVTNVEKPLDLVGLLDSYGVPYSPSVEKSFMRYLEEDLDKQGMLSSSLDLYGLYINKTWELEGIFRNEITIGEMKTMQNYGMDFVRHKYGSERIREDLRYSCEESLEDVTVASYYSDLERPVVLYSCSANDLFYYFNTSLESLNLSKIWKIIKNFGGGLSLLENEVRNNIETLITNNPDSVIMVMGLYVPSDNFFYQRAGAFVIDRVNGILKKICRDYSNAIYVDVSCLAFAVLEGDFHPNGDGHIIIKNILEEQLASIDLSDECKKTEETGGTKKQETRTLVSSDAFTMEEWRKWIEASDLPKRDYVEWAVAAEQTLYENGFDSVSYTYLKTLMDKYSVEASEVEKAGLRILMTERKIHEGFDLEKYTVVQNVRNDKLSLKMYSYT